MKLCTIQINWYLNTSTKNIGIIIIIIIIIIIGGARGVTVIVVGNGHDDTSSNPGRDWLHFTLH